MNYRAEIDGLRALAVVPVVLFHAGFESFGGGYIGVDVFFVISGYLITSIIVNDLNKDKFNRPLMGRIARNIVIEIPRRLREAVRNRQERKIEFFLVI